MSKIKENEEIICNAFKSHIDEHFKEIKDSADTKELEKLCVSIEDLFVCFYSGIFASMIIPVKSSLEKEVDIIIDGVKKNLIEQTRQMKHFAEGNLDTLQ